MSYISMTTYNFACVICRSKLADVNGVLKYPF